MTDYLDSDLDFATDRITVKGSGVQVMMAWELPLMRRMAEIVAMRRGRVLEVGFGMGLSCSEVQRFSPRRHTIIEAHPQIVTRARAWAEKRPGVEIVSGRWQDVIADLGPFDGISFDVFGGLDQRLDFFAQLERLLAPGGAATLWLGDDQEVPARLGDLLQRQGFAWRLSRVVAIPDRSCTYSRTNEFAIPIIRRVADVPPASAIES